MTISNKIINISMAAVTFGVFFFSMPRTHADTVEFRNGDLLTGKITSFDQGIISLVSSLVPDPLRIKIDAIKQIDFPGKNTDDPMHTERLTLVNSDVIPCKVLYMDKEHLYISTWYAGKFRIPRSGIQSLQFGISGEKTIFAAAINLSKWDFKQGNWSCSETSYTSNGIGTLARKLDLSENVGFQFDLAWKETPNFAFRFCAENNSSITKQNTYEFLFNFAGMQIRRYEGSKHSTALLASIPLKPRSFARRRVNIDLRVNRKKGLLTLYIDTKFIGTWLDPLSAAKGNHIILNNRSKSKTSCVIGNLEIRDINGEVLSRHREKTLLGKTDILIDNLGQKFSGILISIIASESDKRVVILDVEHSTQPLRVPDRRMSTLLFAQPENASQFPPPTFTVILDGNGSLQLENPKFIDGKLTSHHPILGSCSINPRVLSRIKFCNTGARNKKTP